MSKNGATVPAGALRKKPQRSVRNQSPQNPLWKNYRGKTTGRAGIGAARGTESSSLVQAAAIRDAAWGITRQNVNVPQPRQPAGLKS